MIGWTLAEHFRGRPTDVPLADGWGPRDGGFASGLVDRLRLADLIADLPRVEQEACHLVYLEGLSPADAAIRLGTSANNVHQRAFLARAGEGADELARLIDGFVRVVPAPEPGEDDVVVMRARGSGESLASSRSAPSASARWTRSWPTWRNSSRSRTYRASSGTTSGWKAPRSIRNASTSACGTRCASCERRAFARPCGR